MKIKFASAEEAEKVKAKALLLAYRASVPMGLGFIHARPDDEKDSEMLAEYVVPGKNLFSDYISGRMVKLNIYQPEPDALEVQDNAPQVDYQSWARKYPTFEALIEAARG